MVNSKTPSRSSLSPAMSIPFKPKDRRPKERKSFWSANSHELDRIGWNTRYAFSDSDDSDEVSDTEDDIGTSDEDGTSITNDEDNAKIDTPNGSDKLLINKNEDNNKNTISITTIIDQEPSAPKSFTERECHCHQILKGQLDSYDEDVRQQILLEVYNWLNGGEHSCSSLDDALTEQQREDYHQLISPQDYWTEVHWAADTQHSEPEDEEAIIDDTQVNHDEEDWEDMGIDVLIIQRTVQVEWIAVLAFVSVGPLIMVVLAEFVMRWFGEM